MEAHYNYAVKAGVFTGILLGIISTVLYLIHFNQWGTRSLVCNGYLCFLGAVFWFIIAGMGYQVVGHSRTYIHNKSEAVALSVIAGVVAGVINGVVQTITTAIIPNIINLLNGFMGHDAIMMLLTSILGIVVIVIVTTFMSVIGGVIYLTRIVKLS